MRESQFQKKVIAFLKERKVWHVKYWAGSQYTKEGVHDILACIDGVFHGIELKTDIGQASKLQLYNIQQLRIQAVKRTCCVKDFEAWKVRPG